MADTRKLIIIGSGPAGYTAGVYAARAELKPLMFAGEKYGGQLMDTTMVENWPGTEKGILGPDLMQEMRQQAIKFGCEMVDKNVSRVDFSKAPFRVWEGENEYQAEAVIVSTGAESIMLGVPGEKELLGRGVSTCAVCDAPFFKGKNVFVVGGGDAAAEDILTLSKYADKLTLLVRRDELRASKIMARRVKEHQKINILWNTELKEIIGTQKVEKVKIVNNQTHSQEELAAEGVFLAIGHKPTTAIFKGQLELNEKNYLKILQLYPEMGQKSPADNWLHGYATQTSIEGVFGAGDVVDYRYRQAVTAAGMGCQAALDAEKFLTGTNPTW
jgi:thioredoxin reductase (NADPH)